MKILSMVFAATLMSHVQQPAQVADDYAFCTQTTQNTGQQSQQTELTNNQK